MSSGKLEHDNRLLGWLERPSGDRGLRMFSSSGWHFTSYRELARGVNGVASDISASAPGVSRAAVMATDPDQFAKGFFGALAAGVTPVPIAPPELFGKEYEEQVAYRLMASGAGAVLVADDLRAPLLATLPLLDRDVNVLALSAASCGALPAPRPPGIGLVQFTSGSTSRPRAVEVQREALEAHLGMIASWLSLTQRDSAASWLPLYHDMGLTGMLLCSVTLQVDLWWMPPEHFIRSPLEFLRCIGLNGITITGSPTFGYGYMSRRIRPEQLDGTDFSCLRAAIVGAERIDPAVMSAFARLILDRGFAWESIRPAYGLAEATLAVSGQAVRRPPSVIEVDWNSLRPGSAVTFTRSRLDKIDDHVGSVLVSCGPPLEGTTLTIVDDSQVPLPEGHLGEIVVRGPAVAAGYASDAGHEASTRIEGDYLFTGDAGLIVDGELYVIGRITDCIKVRGRRVYAEQIEEDIAKALGMSVDRCAVLPGHAAGNEEIIAVIETRRGERFHDAATVLTSIVGSDFGIKVYAVSRDTIPRTTSGKKRRRELARGLSDKELNAELVYNSVSESHAPNGSAG